jgi:hypothetical protein
VCVDDGPSKRPIFDHLTQMGIPFIDVGMGVSEVNGTLTGIVRTTTSTPEKRDHVDRHVSFGRPVDDEYRSNIQIADLNALNAALAVIRWKRYRGFYADLEREHNSLYAIDGNHLTNEDLA